MKTFKRVRWLIFSIALIGLSPQVSKAQTEAAIATGVYEAVSYTAKNWTKIKWVVTGAKHRWWACIYADGFVTYNNFRSYRNSMEVYGYFVLGRGDCDSVYDDQYGRTHHICYETPMHAKRYTDIHGPIVDIQYQDNGGRYHSIFEY